MSARALIARLLAWPALPRAVGLNALFIALALGLGGIAMAAALAGPGATYTTFVLWDPLIFVDNAYRLQQGQFPHRDFHSSLGVLTIVIPYLGLEVGGSFAACLPTALALVLLATTPLAVYVLATRLRLAIALPFGLFLLLLIASPMVTGGPPSQITMALWYNRQSWALLALLFMLYLPPYRRTAAVAIADGVVAAIIIVVCVYTKITYGLVALAFPLIWWVLDREARRSAILAAALVAAVIVAAELIWQLNRLYIADIAFAIRSGPALRGGLLQPIDVVFIHASESALLAGAALVLWWAGAAPARDYLFFLIGLGAAALITNQNSDDAILPSNLAIIVIAAERLARGVPAAARPPAPVAASVTLGLLLAFIAQPSIYHTLGLYRHARGALAANADPALPPALYGFPTAEYWGLNVVPGRAEELFPSLVAPGLAVDDAFEMIRFGGPGRESAILSASEYLFQVARGIEALDGIDPGDGTVFVFDSINPFQFLLGLRPSTGHLFAYDFNRQFSADNYIPVDVTFATISLAMVPKFQVGHRDRQALEALYGDYLRTHFAVVRDTPYWTVWQRQGPLPAR